MHNLRWFSRLFSNAEVNNHIHAVLIQRSRIGLPPICKQGSSSSSGMSYWFRKQLDVNWGEASLINFPGNTNTFVNSFILWKAWGKEEQIRSVPHALLHATVLAYLTSQKKKVLSMQQNNPSPESKAQLCADCHSPWGTAAYPSPGETVRAWEVSPPSSLIQERICICPWLRICHKTTNTPV